jgi:Zn-dependent protease
LPRFRLFDIPVAVHPSFLIIAVLLGWSAGFASPQILVGWVLIVVFSILIHEFGHALVARSFGASVAIELNGLGGLTRWGMAEGELPPGKRALVAASGSAVGLVFGGIVWLVATLTGPFEGTAAVLLGYLVYVNVFWGLLNWLPIRPLDGGHLLASLLDKLAPTRAESIARVVFTATAGLALAAALYFRLIFVGILAAWLLVSELGLGSRSRPRPPGGLPTLSYDPPEVEPGPTETPAAETEPADRETTEG